MFRFKSMRFLVILAAVGLASAKEAQAQGLPNVPAGTVLTETMMDAQASEALLYGAMLGASSTPQSLSGTSSTDPSTGSFSFSLNPGSTYLGQAISDSVQGQWNPATSSYQWTAVGAWGDVKDMVKWAAQGNITPIEIEVTPDKLLWQANSTELVQGPGKLMLPDKVTLIGDGKKTPALSFRTSTLQDNAGRPLGTATGLDTYNAKEGAYDFKEIFVPRQPPFQKQLLQYGTSGMAPFTGGSGTYTTSISSTPEPSSIVMCLIGVLGIAGYAWWMKVTRWRRAPAGC
jgi:hypothetical protein